MVSRCATDMRLLRRCRSMTEAEIHALRERLEAAPENRMPPGSFWLYTRPTRAKLDAIARALAERVAERRSALNSPKIPDGSMEGPADE